MGGHAVQHRAVAVEGPGPVHSAHVGAPEVVPHDAAGLLVHLPPLGGRVDEVAYPAEVDGDVGVAVVVVRGAPVAGDHLQAVVRPEEDALAVAADLEVVGVGGQMLHAALDQVVALQVGLGVGVLRGGAGGAEFTGDGVAQPEHAVLGGAQVGVAGGLDGERHDPVGEPFEVDPGGRGALAVGRLVLVRRVDGPPVPLRSERRGRGRGQRDQVRAGTGHEGQVEDVLVIDRVEGAGGEEGEVLAVLGERRRVVLEAQRRGLGDGQVRGVGQPQLAERARSGVRPGQPGRVRGEDQSRGVAVGAAVDLADLAGLPLDEQHAPVVRGDGGPAAVGGHREAQNTAELPGGEPARGGARGEPGRGGELQRVVTLGVGHPHRPLLPLHAEGAGLSGPYAGFGGQGAGGS